MDNSQHREDREGDNFDHFIVRYLGTTAKPKKKSGNKATFRCPSANEVGNQ